MFFVVVTQGELKLVTKYVISINFCLLSDNFVDGEGSWSTADGTG